MKRPEITIHDLATNEVVVREMNDEEYEQYKLDMAQAEAEAAAQAEAEIQKQALLDKLGITADEAKLLLS